MFYDSQLVIELRLQVNAFLSNEQTILETWMVKNNNNSLMEPVRTQQVTTNAST